jgi:hypothetical protein
MMSWGSVWGRRRVQAESSHHLSASVALPLAPKTLFQTSTEGYRDGAGGCESPPVAHSVAMMGGSRPCECHGSWPPFSRIGSFMHAPRAPQYSPEPAVGGHGARRGAGLSPDRSEGLKTTSNRPSMTPSEETSTRLRWSSRELPYRISANSHRAVDWEVHAGTNVCSLAGLVLRIGHRPPPPATSAGPTARQVSSKVHGYRHCHGRLGGNPSYHRSEIQNPFQELSPPTSVSGLMEGGHHHPVPYRAFPLLSPHQKFGSPNSLGSTSSTSQINKELMGSREIPMTQSLIHRRWRKMLDIINMLQCRQWSNLCEGFNTFVYWELGPPIVKVVVVDHLKHTVSLKSNTFVPHPEPLTYDENFAILKSIM